MKRAVVFCAVLVCAAALFSGCALKEKRPKMDISLEDGKTVYDGCEQYFYEVKENQEGTLSVAIRKESGSIDIKVFRTDDRKMIAYQGNDIPTSEFKVTLSDPGEYKVWVEADDFMGSYTFDWSVKAAGK